MNKIIVTTEDELEYLIRKVLTEILSPLSVNGNPATVVPIPEIMNMVQASEFISVSKSYLYKLTSERSIPHFKRGKRIYFKKDELIGWITQNRKPTIEEQVAEYEMNRLRRNKR